MGITAPDFGCAFRALLLVVGLSFGDPCFGQTQQNSPATPQSVLIPPVVGNLKNNNNADSPQSSMALEGIPVGPAAPDVEAAICAAIGRVGELPGGAQAMLDLSRLKDMGRILTAKRNLPFPAMTIPDFELILPGGYFDKWSINVPDWENWIVVPEPDFDPPPGGPGTGPAVHKWGEKGLAIMLYHEWRHTHQVLLPWDKGWNRIRFRKCMAMYHVESHVFDQSIIDACLQVLAGDARERLLAMSCVNKNNIRRNKEEVKDTCRRLQ